MKTTFFQRTLWVAVALSSTTMANADIQYTTQTSIAQDGELKPMSSVTTWLKTGLERTDSSQTIANYHMAETTISNKATGQTIIYNPDTKMYVVTPLSSAGGAATGTTAAAMPTASGGGGVGKMILTLGAQFLGLAKMLDRPVRHYKTSVGTESTGCCGTGSHVTKSEVWMADVQLPAFDASASGTDWQRAYAAANSKCKIQFERKGDVKGYEAAMKGLALKTISFDAAGKPLFASEITSLSGAPLTADEFAVPAGYKKVTRAEYDAARSQAMLSAMMPKQNQEQNQEGNQ